MTDRLVRIRALTLALPETTERLSHGQPTFFVAGRQFAQYRENHHNDGLTVVCVKTSGADEQSMLIEAAPEIYSRPAYLGPSGWVSVNLDDDVVDWDLVTERIEKSWDHVAPRRLIEETGS